LNVGGRKEVMDKAKYEKPMLVELGFDGEVMGVRCKTGSAEVNKCTPGSIAKTNCGAGTSYALGTVCTAGGAPAS